MDIDIRAALDGAPARSGGKCKIQAWLDEIDKATPALDDLVRMIAAPAPEPGKPRDPDYLPLKLAVRVLNRLGLETSDDTISDHRSKRCRCFH